jgi:uncharacterized protein (TIGR00251 family)
MDDDWAVPAAAGTVVRVHVRPGAAGGGVTGLHGGALAVRVAARPVAGAANREVVALLASALGIGRSAVEIASGARGRDKRVLVHGLAPAAVRAKLERLLRI